MKKFFALLIGIICFSFSHAQVYHPFPDSSAKWSEYWWEHSYHISYNTSYLYGKYLDIAGDTLIDSVQYHLIGYQHTYTALIDLGTVLQADNLSIQYPGEIIGAIREDSTKKVWFRVINPSGWNFCFGVYAFPHIINTDILIYDFNINIGDSLSWKPYHKICTAIDSITLSDGSKRKTYGFDYDSYGDRDEWIEGIGSWYGLLGAYSHYNSSPQFDDSSALVCFTQDSVVLYVANGGASSCDSSPFGIGINETEISSNLYIFSNPASNSINISSSSLSGKYSLKIYNLLGQQVKQQEIDFSFEGNSKVTIESLASGYYQLMLVNGSNLLSKRFIKE